jgi:single-stranded-DNA-specific exonuclease
VNDAAATLAREVGLSLTVATFLAGRGFEADDRLKRWLGPKLAHLTPPEEMADLDAASQRIARAIRNRERIVVFGDYDCDGITSAAILTEVIGVLGGDVQTELANRFAGGYGFSDPALKRVRERGASLLVTCDCGSSDHERLAAAQKVGIDTVVIDHHLVPKEKLPAVAFLNPHRPECGYPFKGLASCGLAIIVAAALRRELDANIDVRRWLDLCAVGTIADVAPLDGDNRPLVRAGLKVLSHGARVGLSALAINGARGKRLPMSAEDVAFQVAPRINAPGRLGDPMLALSSLLERDSTRAWEIAAKIERVTEKRREIQRTMVAEALAEISSKGFASDPAIVLARQGWHPGVVGIVAGRIADKFQKPTIVVALEGPTGRGSARAIKNFRLYDAIAAARDAVLGFGGHQAAAGVELSTGQVDHFRDLFNQACQDQLAVMPEPAPVNQPDVRLDERDDVAQVLLDLEKLEPCGEKNRPPKLLIDNVEILSAKPIKEHLKLEVMLRGQRIRGFGPDLGALAATLSGTVKLVGRLKRDHWTGSGKPEILVEAVLDASPEGL